VTVASVDYNVNTDPRSCATEHGMAVRFLGLIPDGNVAQFRLFAVMICCSFTQMTVAVLGTALLADYDSRIAIGMWAGRFASMYAIKIIRQDLSYYLPIRGIAGKLLSLCMARPFVSLVTDFSFFLHGRLPYEMGVVQWWSGRVWAWLLLVISISLRARGSTANNAESPLTNATLSGNQPIGPLLPNATALSETLSLSAPWLTSPEVLAALVATLFGSWLLSHLAFFCLCKRECLTSFWMPHTAAAYVQIRWDVQSEEKRAAVLVKMHPDLLRLVASNARLWIGMHWDASPDDRPEWMNDRWLRAVPSSILPKKVLIALGGKHRRKSSLAERLELASDKAVSVPDPVTLLAEAVPSDSVVADATSSAERPALELLAVVPTRS
jgi:hypothetical protein